ncbi:MAG: P-II family nitrogen regulator [Anaerobacillus sp.]|uniref:P-II family nitrogen regulator n=1 Tax=Anaerobacillus sp. TaxID=1872506 RepID=UPI00391DA991
MTLYKAEKVVIITEKLILKGVCEIIEACGGSGYTIVAAGGKGSRNVRSTSDRALVIEDFANVKIEVIVKDKTMAETIMVQVAGKYFENYSGITYVEDVEILRPKKFNNN